MRPSQVYPRTKRVSTRVPIGSRASILSEISSYQKHEGRVGYVLDQMDTDALADGGVGLLDYNLLKNEASPSSGPDRTIAGCWILTSLRADDVLRELVVVLPGHVGPKLVDEAVDLAQAEDSKRLKETEAR